MSGRDNSVFTKKWPSCRGYFCHKCVSFLKEKVSIPFGSKELEGALTVPETECVQTALILTHGAGGDMNLKPLMSLAQAAATSGLLCLRFTCKSLNLAHRVRAYEAAVVSVNYNYSSSHCTLGHMAS